MSLSRRKFLKFLGVAGAAAAVAPSALVVEPASAAPGPVAKLWKSIFRKDLGLTKSVEVQPFKDAYAHQVAKMTKRLARKLESTIFSVGRKDVHVPLTYGSIQSAVARHREDLIDVVTNIDPWETPWAEQVPKVTAPGAMHAWLQDELPPITVYESDFGVIRVVEDPSCTASANGGYPLTEADFNDMLERIYNEGGNPEEIVVGPTLYAEMKKNAESPGRLRMVQPASHTVTATG